MAIGTALGIAGLGLSALGTGINFISQARQAREQRRALDKQEKDNENWYNRRYNEDMTQRGTAQAALTAMRDAQRARMARSAGAEAVTGASSEVSAAEKQAANKAIGDTMSTINAQGDAVKDKVESQYMSEKRNIANQRANLRTNQMQNTALAAGQAASVAGGIIANSGEFGKTPKQVSTPGASTQQQAQNGGTGYWSVNPVTGATEHHEPNPFNGNDLITFNSTWGTDRYGK